jgi:hypothetical protein
VTPIELFDAIREKGMTAAQTAFLESGKPWPDEGTVEFIKTMVGIGIAVSCEHFAQHPEHLAIAGQALCVVCREPVDSWQVGIDPARDPADQTDPIKVAWPCGHRQPFAA